MIFVPIGICVWTDIEEGKLGGPCRANPPYCGKGGDNCTICNHNEEVCACHPNCTIKRLKLQCGK